MIRKTTKYTVLVGLNNPNDYSNEEARAIVVRTAADSFSGFSILDVTGYWDGQSENSVQVMVIADGPRTGALVEAFASDVRNLLDQDSVWVLVEDATVIEMNRPKGGK